MLKKTKLRHYFLFPVIGGALMLSFSSVDAKTVTANKFKPQKITSRSQLIKLITSKKTNRYQSWIDSPVFIADTAVIKNTTATPSLGESATKVSHSDTNIQVQGVDESDNVKVDDKGYIYQIHNNQIRIIKGFPVANLQKSATLDFSDANFYPAGIYVDNNRLVVLGSSWQQINDTQYASDVLPTGKMAIWGGWWWNSYSQTRAIVYDISNPEKPKQERDVSVDGDYLDSRRIGDNLYFISRTYPRYYAKGGYSAVKNTASIPMTDVLPNIIDKRTNRTIKKQMALTDITYFPDFVEPDYITVTSLNLTKPNQSLATKAYLGASEIMYASTQNMYLSKSNYAFNFDENGGILFDNASSQLTTQLSKFNLDNGNITFKAAGEVKGTLLNQFSMDEQGDYFRVATTTHAGYNGQKESQNAIYVLDKNMQLTGSVENLAPNEQIYAARFLGNRCYMVTFRLIDPLFVIDLSSPQKPAVMGELKIPGYSNYLHPYDENHLIGFGKDAAVFEGTNDNSADQFWANGGAFYQGLKLSMFDVSDMKNPKELHSITIGDRGSDSDVLWNHKALFTNQERHLFGFPLTIAKFSEGEKQANQPWQYANPTYQGAHIYEVTPEKGFVLKAALSNIENSTNLWDNYGLFINRLVSIENNVYSLSNDVLKIYDLEQFQKQTELSLIEK